MDRDARMGIVSKFFPNRDEASAPRKSAHTDWIDLSDYAAHEKVGDAGASTWVRFAEIRQLDDLKKFSTLVYDGSMLVLDFRPVQGDEVTLRRLTNELRKLAQDTGGDLSGLGDHHILVTPAGVKVDRKKILGKETEADAAAPPVRSGPGPSPAPSFAAPAPTPSAGLASLAESAAAPARPGRRMNGVGR